MSIELKPCPFCGPGNSMVDLWFDDVSKRWAVGCGRCGSSSGRSVHAEGSKEKAAAAWNTRAPQQAAASDPGREALEQARKDIAAIQAATVAGRVCDDVAWFDTITTLHDFCAQSLDNIDAALTAPNPPAGDWQVVPREAIARIIDPKAFNASLHIGDDSYDMAYAQQVALNKADAILSLSAAPKAPAREGEAVAWLQNLDDLDRQRTPGPWKKTHDNVTDQPHSGARQLIARCDADWGGFKVDMAMASKNARFIVALENAWPKIRAALYATPDHHHAPDPERVALVEALADLVALKDKFDQSNRNQQDAYYLLVKGRDKEWEAARSILSSLGMGRGS